MLSYPKVNILVAYNYFKPKIFQYLKAWTHDEYDLLIDSGAFSAWSLGKEVKLDDYCKFLDSLEPLRPFKAIQLDVIKNHKKTFENLQIMKNRGYDVIPVFTRGTPIEMLDELYSYNDYICVGGVAFGSKNKNYVRWLLDQNQGRKVHLLGFTNVDFIKYYKPISVDSSSWMSTVRYGSIDFYKGNGVMQRVQRKQFINKPSPEIYRYAANSNIKPYLVNKLRFQSAWKNVGVPTLVDNEKSLNRLHLFLGATSHLKRADDIQKYTGTKYYFACNGWDQLAVLERVLKFLTKGDGLSIPEGVVL